MWLAAPETSPSELSNMLAINPIHSGLTTTRLSCPSESLFQILTAPCWTKAEREWLRTAISHRAHSSSKKDGYGRISTKKIKKAKDIRLLDSCKQMQNRSPIFQTTLWTCIRSLLELEMWLTGRKLWVKLTECCGLVGDLCVYNSRTFATLWFGRFMTSILTM